MSGDGPAEPSTIDHQLAEIVDDLLVRIRRGEVIDLDAVIRDFPDCESELREIWPTLQLAEHLAVSSSGRDDATGNEQPIVEEFPKRIGDYELLEVLGRGGMGVVYRARQISLDRVVALKMILRGEMAGETDRLRFRTEAESAAKLAHPNIVPVYEVGELSANAETAQPFFSMQLVEGPTLAARLADGPLAARDAAETLVPVCRAIAAAHRQGILHRDLKASNILLDRESRPFVSDFGLAKRLDPEPYDESPSLTRTGAILGTPAYMAPEQAGRNRGEIAPATDVYSLGAILYATLTGHPPFQAASPVDVLRMLLEEDPLPPRMINKRVDPDLEMICLKCLQKPPELRYESADAVADDLERYLRGEAVSARSSQFTRIISRAFRETHHASVLENWGLLWMWHSVALLLLCFSTNAMQFAGVESRWPYVGLWVFGLGVWAGTFWNLRKRAGPITFVERQVAHIWAAALASSTTLFAVEAALGLSVLSLSPVLGIISGTVFVAKAGILSGSFYLQATALFATAIVMAMIHSPDSPDLAISVFGIVAALCFFLPGLKYYRQRVSR